MVSIAELEAWEAAESGDYDNPFASLEWVQGNSMEAPFGTVHWVDGYTGGEGGGSDAHVIFRVENQFFRKQGYYASHYGTDWDGGITEVFPVEKVVTVYEEKR